MTVTLWNLIESIGRWEEDAARHTRLAAAAADEARQLEPVILATMVRADVDVVAASGRAFVREWKESETGPSGYVLRSATFAWAQELAVHQTEDCPDLMAGEGLIHITDGPAS